MFLISNCNKCVAHEYFIEIFQWSIIMQWKLQNLLLVSYYLKLRLQPVFWRTFNFTWTKLKVRWIHKPQQTPAQPLDSLLAAKYSFIKSMLSVDQRTQRRKISEKFNRNESWRMKAWPNLMYYLSTFMEALKNTPLHLRIARFQGQI